MNPHRPVSPPHSPSDTARPSDATGCRPDQQTIAGAGPASATDQLPPVEGYRVMQKLGEGGMGSVYLAEDTKLGRKTAIKTMKPALAASKPDRDRFVREARAAAAVESDYIVPIWQVGEAADGTPFIAMPFLQGESLDARLRRESVAPLPLVLKVAGEVAAGLAAAHAKGLVHRDIKPANIWLEGDLTALGSGWQVRRCKILDFGLARSTVAEDAALTAPGAVMGTPAYMAPEQARGERVDHRADLWSLGATLYRMATGRPPFHGPTVMAVLTALATEEPPPVRKLRPDLPRALAELIHQLMSKDPNARPRSAADVIAIVHPLAARAQSKTEPPTVPSRGASRLPNRWATGRV